MTIMNASPLTRARNVLGGACAALLFTAPMAFAHSHLVSASPAPRATVASPTAISLRFSEPLEDRFSGFDVKDSSGHMITTKVHAEGDDNTVLVGKPTSPLAPGIYNVAWHLVAKDGHRMKGAFPFTVR